MDDRRSGQAWSPGPPTGAKGLPLHWERGAERNLKTEVVKGFPIPTGAKDLPLHQEREAEKSQKTSPEKQACSRTEQSEEERFWAAEELISKAPRRF